MSNSKSFSLKLIYLASLAFFVCACSGPGHLINGQFEPKNGVRHFVCEDFSVQFYGDYELHNNAEVCFPPFPNKTFEKLAKGTKKKPTLLGSTVISPHFGVLIYQREEGEESVLPQVTMEYLTGGNLDAEYRFGAIATEYEAEVFASELRFWGRNHAYTMVLWAFGSQVSLKEESLSIFRSIKADLIHYHE